MIVVLRRIVKVPLDTMHICADADVDAGRRSHFIHPPAIQYRRLHNRTSPSIHVLTNESTRKAFRLSMALF
jgi:hypothetical protein